MIINRIFGGNMNLDAHEYRVRPGDYIDALNITRDAQGESQDLVTSNLLGNRLISYAPVVGAFTAKRIGSKADPVRNRVYYFVWKSNDEHLILYYDASTDSINPLLENITDTANVDILGFDPSYRINHIDIIYRDASEGDLLFWTDGLNRPFFLNVKDAEDRLYDTNWLLKYITVNRPLPLIAPICGYSDDSGVKLNNLRKKLYQFRYRWVYKNFEKSCWSPISKLFAPTDPDDIADDIDAVQNNRIDIIIPTGAEDVTKIEVAARQSIEIDYSPFFLIATLDKAALVIDSDSTTEYIFYNDAGYPFIDEKQSTLLYSQVPQKAYSQAMPNGNVLTYGAITEGYDFDETLSVTAVVDLVSNSQNLGLTIIVSESIKILEVPEHFVTGAVKFTFSGGLTNVTTITLYFTAINSSGTEVASSSKIYTIVGGETLTSIRNFFVAEFPSGGFFAENATPGVALKLWYDTGDGEEYEMSGTFSIAYAGAAVNDVNISAYKHRARYGFGLVYFDEYGETDGVHYDPETMNLLMPELITTGGTVPTIPEITFTVNHQPPIWATNFAWVRTTNLTFQNSISVISLQSAIDSSLKYGWFDISNLQENQNNYSAYEFTDGDRVRIAGKYIASNNGTVVLVSESVYDFPVVGLIVNPVIGSATVPGIFIKIPYDNAAFTALGIFTGSGIQTLNHYLLEIYTPAPNTDKEQQVYYEFGENYAVINPGTATRAHEGSEQGQIVGTQPAIFIFIRGDFYQRKRTYNSSIAPTPSGWTPVTVWIMSKSVSDLYPSRVQSIGRAFLENKDARETYFPVTVRFGLEYQQNTSVNEVNIFYPENLDDYDRSNGDIRKLFIEGRYMYVFQKFDTGVVPILTQIIKDVSGNPLEANSDELLNRITYPYRGKYGIGNVPESFSYYNYAKYFVDPSKRVVCRLSQDGITVLSVLYECNSFFVDKLEAYNSNYNTGVVPSGEFYTGDPTVYGSFNFFTNRYIVDLEEITRYDYVIEAPTTAPVGVLQSGGTNDISTYQYEITFVNASGEESPVSPESNIITTDIANRRVNLTEIPVSADPTVTKRRIYRNLSGTYYLATTIDDNTTTSFLFGVHLDLYGDPPDPAIEEVSGQSPFTLTFAEVRTEAEGFESFVSYHTEGLDSLGTLLISWKDGKLWVHDSETYCNYYGVQYDAYIIGVFNDNPLQKKTWLSMAQMGNTAWDCPEITTQLISYGTTPQQSELKTVDFTTLESQYHASFLKDSNSIGGLIEGDALKGNYMVIKLRVAAASQFVFLNGVSVEYIDSPLTMR